MLQTSQAVPASARAGRALVNAVALCHHRRPHAATGIEASPPPPRGAQEGVHVMKVRILLAAGAAVAAAAAVVKRRLGQKPPAAPAKG